jgi:serine protease Do
VAKLKQYFLYASTIFVVLTANMGHAAQEVAHSTAINVTADGITKTAQFKIWKSNIEPTEKVGKFARGLFCSDPFEIPYDKNLDAYNVSRLSKIYSDRSLALGYPKFEGEQSAFAEKLGTEADFKVGFTLLSMNYDICGGNNEVSGTSSIKMKIELYSTKLKKIVYFKVLDGAYSSSKKIKMEQFDEALFLSSLENAFSDKNYVNVFKDMALKDSLTSEKIIIENGTRIVDGIKKNTKAILTSVITVESGLGVGSGFYIGKDGYIISNYHVVGESKFVKVKFSGGHSIVGEVVRTDPVRDVALIKTASESPVQVSIRKLPVKIGEEVFAIGSPFGEQLSGTVTRGIISAERFIDDLKYIQSDVSINPGNSGGPLVDIAGDVVAIAELKKENAAGIGLFIPIAEVLDKLGIIMR